MGKISWRRERQPTPVFLPGKSHGQRTWWATVHGVVKESDMTEPSCTGGYSNSVWNHKGPWESLSAINANFLFLVGISSWQPQAAWRTCSEGRPRASIWPAAWGPWRSWYWMKLTDFWTWVLRQGTEVWTSWVLGDTGWKGPQGGWNSFITWWLYLCYLHVNFISLGCLIHQILPHCLNFSCSIFDAFSFMAL